MKALAKLIFSPPPIIHLHHLHNDMNRSVAFLAVFLSSVPAAALEPKEVFLLVNKNVPASKEIADHYCQKRGVPAGNIILLDVPTGEDISRVRTTITQRSLLRFAKH